MDCAESNLGEAGNDDSDKRDSAGKRREHPKKAGREHESTSRRA